MPYNLRLLPEIVLISPLGTMITCKWADDERGFEKSIQRDKYPLIHGETGVDFGGGADAYDIVLIFDGMECDLTSNQFYETAKELGTWFIIHPMYGMIELQLLSLRQRVSPVASGGCFEIETHWMEPLDPLTMMTMRQLTGIVDAQLAAVVSASAGAFAAGSVLAGFGSLAAIANIASAASAIANKIAAKVANGAMVAASAAIAVQQTEAAQAKAANSVAAAKANTADFDPMTIATSMHEMMQGPVLGCSDSLNSIALMNGAAQMFAAMLPAATTPVDINRVQTAEVGLEAVLGAACLSTTIGNLETRTQAIEAARALVQLLKDITTLLDGMYEAFAGQLRPNFRYYAQTKTYNACVGLVTSCVKYLIQQSFDLRIEKRIVLDREKTPIQICAEEFGLKGEDNLDSFIAWNSLEGDDVMILPISREVVVYVEPKSR